jgi:hypothetical protein
VSSDDAAAATRALAERTARLDPSLATTAFIKDDRGGLVFIDSTRAHGATVVAAYSPRARPGVPVFSRWPGMRWMTCRHGTSPIGMRRGCWRALTPGPQACQRPRRCQRSLSRRGTRSRSPGSRPCTRASAGPAPSVARLTVADDDGRSRSRLVRQPVLAARVGAQRSDPFGGVAGSETPLRMTS